MPFFGGIKHIKNVADCEKRAWFLHSAIQRERAEKAEQLPENERYTWAFGWTLGIRHGVFGSQSHSMNIAVTSDEGIIIIEPLTNVIEKVDLKKYSVFAVVM